MRRVPPCCLIVSVTLLVAAAARAAENRPDSRIKELQILDRLAGSWAVTQPGTKRKGKTVSEWILGGRVLQTKSTLGDGRELLILRTYDPSLKKFIVSIWDSQGMALILSGDWNAEEQTLTATADAGRTRVTAVSRLVDADTEQWQVQFTDPNGKVQRQIGGTNRREPASE